jgi:ABC-type antimicrobial peptide transport system permease subunit
MLIRIAGNRRLSVGGIREIIRRLDSQMATTIQDLASVSERQGERLKPVMVDGTIGGLLALLLAITGVYGVVSFTVSQRVHEIGIRIALGAQRGQIILSIMRTGTTPVLGGLVVGIGLAFVASVAIEATVAGLRARDPFVFSLVPMLLLMAALFAIWIPARRAAAMDPHSSIRYE